MTTLIPDPHIVPELISRRGSGKDRTNRYSSRSWRSSLFGGIIDPGMGEGRGIVNVFWMEAHSSKSRAERYNWEEVGSVITAKISG